MTKHEFGVYITPSIPHGRLCKKLAKNEELEKASGTVWRPDFQAWNHWYTLAT